MTGRTGRVTIFETFEGLRATEWSVRAILLVLLPALLASCAGAAPYERGKLAHPTMSTSDIAGAAEEHVRAVQEGAWGGDIGVGGGCGCN
jgi:hypothetical protein